MITAAVNDFVLAVKNDVVEVFKVSPYDTKIYKYEDAKKYIDQKINEKKKAEKKTKTRNNEIFSLG